MSDSSTTVAIINNQGSNRSRTLNESMRPLLDLAFLNNWHLSAAHIPGFLNTWADSLSRIHPIKSEWCLHDESFQTLNSRLHAEIDLFAHPGNAKLDSFGCAFPHPLATVHDAMSANWNRWKRIYLFPPLELIPQCLQKLQFFDGRAVLIAPRLVRAPWWPWLQRNLQELSIQLGICKQVQNRTVWLQEETSLSFNAFLFSKKC